jgi:uncharacterized protein YecT (DUF1311 family)
MIALVLAALLFAGCSTHSIAQSPPGASTADTYVLSPLVALGDYPLDRDLQACIEADPGTSGVTRCYSEHLKSYEAQLNRNYQRARALLGPGSSSRLQSSQSAWEIHMEKEFKLIEAQYQGMEGTQYQQLIAIEKLALVRARCLQLHMYAQALAADRE